ncbi:hybrid sensor histidine kinase/response regulator, partial [Amaricoccus sp. HAR-UPW-R2A-40]
GFTFDVAQHGAEALIAWERRAYDLILMDVEMPVVEDNATNQFVLSLFLKRLGFTFDVAQHGAEALIAWERRAYDLILMDVEMPV